MHHNTSPCSLQRWRIQIITFITSHVLIIHKGPFTILLNTFILTTFILYRKPHHYCQQYRPITVALIDQIGPNALNVNININNKKSTQSQAAQYGCCRTLALRSLGCSGAERVYSQLLPTKCSWNPASRGADRLEVTSPPPGSIRVPDSSSLLPSWSAPCIRRERSAALFWHGLCSFKPFCYLQGRGEWQSVF